MDFLNVEYGIAVLRMVTDPRPQQTLEEQVESYVRQTPYLVIDLREVMLTSMQLGELVNLAGKGRTIWGERFAGLFIVNPSDQVRTVLAHTRLESLLRAYPSWSDAVRAIAEVHAMQQDAGASDSRAG